MWRNNVLRLRKGSSAVTLHHGLKTRWYSSEQSLPITQKEFNRSLAKVFHWKWGTESKFPLGFAISGGVDSMALAALYAETQSMNSYLPKPHGFIVDHKVRLESTEEAEWVAEQLRSKFGMESTILTLKWPTNPDTSDHKRFETEARTLRYQALGRACRDKRIPNLMVAHHADDQAETVFMRLANNRLRSGLQGMQSVEWIPECEGIYGVHHSGGYQKHDVDLSIKFPIEKGGIRILRPLLGYEKSRLIATCKDKSVEWAEDKTNHIQMYTSRNAIRHVYKNHTMPEALNVKSLVDLSLSMQQRMQSHKTFAKKLFDRCLIKIDIQTGCAFVRFPPFSSLLDHPIDTERRLHESRNNAFCLLERVAELVSPKAKAPLGQLAATISHIYPELASTETIGQGEDTELQSGVVSSEKDPKLADGLKRSYAVSGVWWRQWDKPSPFPKLESDVDPAQPHPREWLLTRQPLDVIEKANTAHHIICPPAHALSHSSHSSSSTDTYELFDGRFWVRLQNYTDDTLVLRVFHKSDLHHFPTAKQEKSIRSKAKAMRPHRFIAAALDLLKPSDVRFTLPALFRIDSTTGQETLIGFPTLNVRMDGFGARMDVCEWRVRYKKIDFGNRTASEILLPGVSKADILAQEKKQRWQSRARALQKMRPSRGANQADEESNLFTGFKRVVGRGGGTNKVSREKQPKEGNIQPHAMQGEEIDGLSFLEEESKKQQRGNIR